MNNSVFRKSMENMRKHRDYINLSQQKKKTKLFGIRTKLSYYNLSNRISISNRNEKNADTYE